MNLHFEYAIQRNDGKFYNGRANVTTDEMFTSVRQEVLTYSKEGAYRKINTFPAFFASCKVVRLL